MPHLLEPKMHSSDVAPSGVTAVWWMSYNYRTTLWLSHSINGCLQAGDMGHFKDCNLHRVEAPANQAQSGIHGKLTVFCATFELLPNTKRHWKSSGLCGYRDRLCNAPDGDGEYGILEGKEIPKYINQ